MRGLILLFIFISAVNLFARDLDKVYKKTALKVGNDKIAAYIADDDDKRGQGLMFIEKIPEDTGMIFVFEDEHVLGFWMKNTLIPLSIGFFDQKGVLIDIQEMQIAASLMQTEPPSYQSRGPALFALEMNRGWFSKHKIKAGARLSLPAKSPSGLLNHSLGPARR